VILYYFPGACSLASHIALEYTGADYEICRVDFMGNEQRSDEYMRLNPKARVPALVTDHGTLTETPAILAYVAQNWPEAGLAPDEAWGFARAQAFNSYLCSTVHVAHAHKYRGYRWADKESSFEDMRNKVPETMGECFALIEQEMLRGPWVLGEQFSMCDIYLLTIARWLESDEVDTSRLPEVLEHRERMLALPAVVRAINQEESPAG
jgi:glutathione S-transferase